MQIKTEHLNCVSNERQLKRSSVNEDALTEMAADSRKPAAKIDDFWLEQQHCERVKLPAED